MKRTLQLIRQSEHSVLYPDTSSLVTIVFSTLDAFFVSSNIRFSTVPSAVRCFRGKLNVLRIPGRCALRIERSTTFILFNLFLNGKQ